MRLRFWQKYQQKSKQNDEFIPQGSNLDVRLSGFLYLQIPHMKPLPDISIKEHC